MRLLICSFSIYFLVSSGPLLASDLRQHNLEYLVYIGGLRAINISFNSSIRKDYYRGKLKLKTEGLIGKLFKWSSSAFSYGEIKQSTVFPQRAGRDSIWQNKNRKVRLNFQRNGVPIVKLVPEPPNIKYRLSPSLQLAGTRDLIGAIVSYLSFAGESGSCVKSEAIFDGKRRYNLEFENQVKMALTRDQYSTYHGPSLRCHIKLEKIAGFRPETGRYKWITDGSARIWLGRVFPNAMMFPVRIEADTNFGGLFVHLISAEQVFQGESTKIKSSYNKKK